MEVKKSSRADLENKKNIFLEIGLLVALGTVLLAFEWKVSVQEPTDFITVSEIPNDIEVVPITLMNPLPPPPPPPALKTFDLLEVVDDLDPLVEDLEIEDVSDQSDNPTDINITGLTYEAEDLGNEVVPFLPSEDMPAFPGNVQKWIAKNVKYPLIAIENGIQGKVLVQFIVEKNGEVYNIKVVRHIDPLLDKEAIRVISTMPKWKPGKQRGKAVRVSYTLPIYFQLNQN